MHNERHKRAYIQGLILNGIKSLQYSHLQDKVERIPLWNFCKIIYYAFVYDFDKFINLKKTLAFLKYPIFVGYTKI